MTKKTSKSAPQVHPSEIRDHVLEIFACHCGAIMTEKNLNAFGLNVSNGPSVYVTMKVVSYSEDGNAGWDQVEVNGVRVGNRSAARNAYTKLCAPVIAAACALVTD